MVLLLLVTLLRKRPVRKGVVLTATEVDALCDEWTPEPLEKELSPLQELDSGSVVDIEAVQGHLVQVGGVQGILNCGAMNPLGLLGDPAVQQVAEDALRKYGCGSCGPRGFYGTIDVHLELETRLAKFVGCDQTILYSSGFATVASVIPTFAKRQDLIFCDEGVNHAVATGINLSRADVVYFRHNDAAHLREMLQAAASDPETAKKRKFVIVEGLYINYGDVVPLDKVLALKDEFKFYLVVDESYSIGVLGVNGGGVCEVFNAKRGGEDIDILTGNLGNVACSVGGFCSGNNSVVTHQRLNGSGYVFSASLPPYLSCVAMAALDAVENKPELRTTMLKYVALAHKRIGQSKTLRVRSVATSPYIHVALAGKAEHPDSRVENERRLQRVVDGALEKKVLLTRAKYVEAERRMPDPSIRLVLPASMSQKEAERAVEVLCTVADGLF